MFGHSLCTLNYTEKRTRKARLKNKKQEFKNWAETSGATHDVGDIIHIFRSGKLINKETTKQTTTTTKQQQHQPSEENHQNP